MITLYLSKPPESPDAILIIGMKQNLLTFYLIALLTTVSVSKLDVVVTPNENYNWTSVSFILSGPHEGVEWRVCNHFSSVYCLRCYRGIASSNHHYPSVTGYGHHSAENFWSNYFWIDWFGISEYTKLFQHIYSKHNHYVSFDGCCESQYGYYFAHGLMTMNFTPREYWDKMTDYDETDKQLNLIWAYYMPHCEANVITLVGFGTGKLKRYHHYGKPAVFGVPYQLKISSSWTEKIPYENPGDFLTFRWFKYNVMCLDQPWICSRK